MTNIEVTYHDYDNSSDQYILVGRIIQKAKKNGYIHKYKFSVGFLVNCDNAEIYRMIFSHDFAKAFWGKKAEQTYIMRYSDKMINEQGLIRWQVYLQQMVLEKEPLKYLEKFL